MRDRFEKSDLTRRSVLISALGSASLLTGMAHLAEAGTKVSQSDVQYQRAPKDGQDCQHCYQFVAPHGCKMVAGDIVPTGWCGLWVKKPA
jgi:High potential iron-sulfur protein